MSDLHQTAAESSTAILAKLSIPATVTAVTASGFTVNQLVMYVTLAYTITMLLHKLWSWYREIQASKQKDACDVQ